MDAASRTGVVVPIGARAPATVAAIFERGRGIFSAGLAGMEGETVIGMRVSFPACLFGLFHKNSLMDF